MSLTRRVSSSILLCGAFGLGGDCGDDGVNGFSYSPSGDKILFIKDVKLDQNANDIHTDLPKAKARIIDGLMYRHWNSCR